MAIIGVDEAGKGPVIGSMFVVAARVQSEEDLPDDVVDSKKITARRREEIADKLVEVESFSMSAQEVTIEEIDRPDSNMNILTAEAHARAISEIAENGDYIYVDAADVNPERFARRVLDGLNVEVQIISEHRADQKYPIVSAASILAKVARDSHVSDLARTYEDIGSGYPSDSRTIDFLERYILENGTLPNCARKSWKTSKDIMGRNAQKSIEEWD
ncbi:ribonuclease HII [Candidatus Hikarchaeum yamanae]|uniref:ribonuclease HII n=1 Tax=Candidatus Hikarchaeum yamanae TaxID=2675326 RepID=UPI0039E8309F|tara:strand:- start:29111 stop:29758 length:648 start_codon:yes stop_codon:yes gene_type:complete